MKHVTPGQRPNNDAGYLEMMTKVIFMGGLNRQVVEGKWDGFLAAFDEFDVGRVADYNEEKIEALSEDERIIRYAAKIKAVVANARTMLEIAEEHGSFGDWLQGAVADNGVDKTAKAIARQFKYMSEDSSHRYLYAVGEDVGEVSEKVMKKYGS
jgi:3-methyladenine DNA glycosylase Tag